MSDEFDDMSDVNPFNDPAVIAASKRPVTSTYEQKFNVPSQISGMQSNNPPVSPSREFYNTGGGVGIVEEISKFKQREEDIMKRELELKRREEEFEKNRMAGGYKPNNFPRFPKFIPIQPCFYINIEEEIPLEHAILCKRLLIRYYSYSAMMVLNIFLNMFSLFVGMVGAVGALISSIIFALIIIPASFIFVFRSAYIALRSKSSFYYYLFFTSLFCEVCFHFFQALGISGNSWPGFLNGGVLMDQDSKFVGALFIISGFVYCAFFIYGILTLKQFYEIYKSSGGNFQQAQSEFATKVFHAAGNQDNSRNMQTTNIP